MVISSANRRVLIVAGCDGKSDSIMLKRIGLRTEPWGTPFSTILASDVWLPIRTRIVRSKRKSSIQARVLPVIPNLAAL